MDNDLDLTALRAFRAVVREGSFSAAALALRAPKSTLSKRVANLEADLGVRLIERTTRQLRVTTEGAVLSARVDRLLGEADDIRRSLGESGQVPRGHLRVAVPTVMGLTIMGALAARFRTAYPEITLECHFLDRPPDLLEEGFDGVLRFGPLEDSGHVARLVSHGQAIFVAAPGLAGTDRLTHPDQLAALPWVGIATPWPGPIPVETEAGETAAIEPQPALRLGSMVAVRDAVMAGAGVGLLPIVLARPPVAAGRLVRLLPDWATPRKPMYFVYPSAQSVTARLRVFIDFIVAEMKDFETCVPDCRDPLRSA